MYAIERDILSNGWAFWDTQLVSAVLSGSDSPKQGLLMEILSRKCGHILDETHYKAVVSLLQD